MKSTKRRPIHTTPMQTRPDQPPHQTRIVPFNLLAPAQSFCSTCDEVADADVEGVEAGGRGEDGVEEYGGEVRGVFGGLEEAVVF